MNEVALMAEIERIDTTLIGELSWAGRRFPFAGTSNVTISENTTWSDSAGYKKVKKLTIAAGVTLRIIRTPFFLFADEIEFGDTDSAIDISGFDGDQTDPLATFAQGGRGEDRSAGGGGDGGGLLIICARKISGSAGQILANGGDAAYGVSTRYAGQGALSRLANSTSISHRQVWDGSIEISASSGMGYLHPMHYAMARGGRINQGGIGGGSGMCRPGTVVGGGSGIGGGGGCNAVPDGEAGFASARDLLILSRYGCLGGGGGANGGSSDAGGGGGGAVLLYYRDASALPTLAANGGAGNGNGGAGVTYAIQV